MRNPSRLWLTGLGLATLGAGLYLVVQTTLAGGDEKFKTAILKVTDAVKKGDKDGAAKLAQSTAKEMEYLEDIMHFLKQRAKGGLGVGDKTGDVFPDGIEAKLLAMSRDAPSAVKLAKEAKALEEMGYRLAAIGEITLAAAPKSDAGAKKKADWIRWSNDMRTESLALAKALQASPPAPADVKAAAEKINASCNNCHAIFR